MRTLSLLTLAILLLPSPATAQQLVQFENLEIFGEVIKSRSLTAVASFEELAKKPDDSVLILLGDQSTVSDAQLGRFREAGGAILIATNRRTKLDFAGDVSVDGAFVHQDRKTAYKGKSRCPNLPSFESVPFRRHGHPLTSNVKNLATNLPSCLHMVDWLTVDGVAMINWFHVYFPKDCQIGEASDVRLLFLVADNKPAPLIVMAAHSVFFNGMMLQKDNSNLLFAVNCIDWLSESGQENRRRRVMLVQGDRANGDTVIASLGLPLQVPELPAPPVPPVQVLNNFLWGIDRENVLGRLLETAVGRENLLRAGLIGLSLLIALYGGWKLIRGRYWIERNVPLVIDPVEPPAPALTPLEQRHQAQAKSGNHWELAQALARQWFWQHAGIAPTLWEQPDFHMPACAVQGSWWQRWRKARQLQRLQELAQATPVGPVSPREVRRIQEIMRDVTLAAQNQQLQFAHA